jgi:hypothetical protein
MQDKSIATFEQDLNGNARRTGLTVLGLSAVTGCVGITLFILQRAGYVQSDPFIGAIGMIVFSAINAVAGLSMLKPSSV